MRHENDATRRIDQTSSVAPIPFCVTEISGIKIWSIQPIIILTVYALSTDMNEKPSVIFLYRADIPKIQIGRIVINCMNYDIALNISVTP